MNYTFCTKTALEIQYEWKMVINLAIKETRGENILKQKMKMVKQERKDKRNIGREG